MCVCMHVRMWVRMSSDGNIYNTSESHSYFEGPQEKTLNPKPQETQTPKPCQGAGVPGRLGNPTSKGRPGRGCKKVSLV